MHSYTQLLTSFSWEKTREHTEKNKQLFVSSGCFPTFHNLLLTLCNNEKLYFSLEFLEARWFQKKTHLFNSYSSLIDMLLVFKISDVKSVSSGVGGNSSQVTAAAAAKDLKEQRQIYMRQVSAHLAEFCTLRLKCICIYESISKFPMSASTEECIYPLCAEISSLMTDVSAKLQDTLYEGIKANLQDELGLLHSLLEGSLSISQWKFVPATYNLQHCHSILSKWKPIFTNRYRHSGGFRVNLLFGFGIEKNSNPTLALYNWFVKFYQMLNSKATFYFYESFSSSLSPDELKSVLPKMSYDYVTKTMNFLKKNDGNYLRLYINREAVAGGIRHGYTLQSADARTCEETSSLERDKLPLSSVDGEGTNKQQFSLVLHLPRQSVFEDTDDLIHDFLAKVSNNDSNDQKYQSFPLNDSKTTIFCGVVDNTMSVVYSMRGIRSEKDAQVQPHFNDLISRLKMKRVILTGR